MKTTVTGYVNNIITNTLQNIDKLQQLQTEVHPEIDFKYNSINLLISRRSVGKTFPTYQDAINNDLQETIGKYVKKIYLST
jgi:hypothetical protein